MEACELLDAELALDQLEAELAAELPTHIRVLARAYAAGAPLPPAPASVRRPHALAVARRALVHGELFDRALDLVRVLAPTAIADAIGPIGETSWAALARRSAAADAVARSTWGIGFIEMLHRLHGSAAVREGDADATASKHRCEPIHTTAPIAGWREHDGIRLAIADVERAFASLAARHGVAGAVTFVGSASSRPRTFLVEPGREAIVVLPDPIATPQQRWATAHELGHAVAALAARRVWPRVIDETAAAYMARGIEHRDGELGDWFSERARAAREQRHAFAMRLDAVERGLLASAAAMATDASNAAMALGVASTRPPGALFDDPGAQAAYVAAEELADQLERELGLTPAAGALASTLERLRVRVDGRTRL